MTKLRALVEESKFSLILVSHLKRPEGNRGFEDGLAPNLSSLRGSAALSQLSDMVIGLSRNLQGEEKHTTTVTVLKNRFSGKPGLLRTSNTIRKKEYLTKPLLTETSATMNKIMKYKLLIADIETNAIGKHNGLTMWATQKI